MPRPSFTLPVVKPSDMRRQSSARTLQALMDWAAPDIAREAGMEYVEPPQEGETDTRSNLAPRRRVELD